MFKTALFSLFTLSLIIPSQRVQAFEVVIDPGHGGSDLGTFYQSGKKKLYEKDITLKLARKVAYQLIARGIHVFLTRTTDKDVPLPARTALANRLGADVFISIHMNSKHGDSSRDAQGIETYILNTATDASSKRLARLENSVISTLSQPSPIQKDVALILKDLRLDANLKESKRLACGVQENLVQVTAQPRRNRGVKQALFHVLLGADMPSILIEAGFLSNAHDRSFALSTQGQYLISRSIAEAIDKYRLMKKNHNAVAFSRCKIN